MGKLPRLIVRRLWQLLPIVVFATFVVFSLLQLVPGDPAVVLAGDYASEQRIAEIRQLYGLDQPFVVQYGVLLLHALEGNLGRSLLTSQPVAELILYRLPNTILIAVYALVIAGLVGVSLGVLAATRSGTRLELVHHRPCIAGSCAAELLARDDPGRDPVAQVSLVPDHGRGAARHRPLGRVDARDVAGGCARGRGHRRACAPGAQRWSDIDRNKPHTTLREQRPRAASGN